MPFDLSTAGALLALALVVWLPGHALLRLAGMRPEDAGVRWGVAAGLGLALQPLVYLWLHAFRIRMSPIGWWIFLALALGALLWLGRRGGREGREGAGRWRPRLSPVPLPHAVLAILLVAALAARWWAARDLTVPLFGDSVHHTMIVRLFTLHGGLVDDWQPFVPLASFTYHFGFHALAATLTQLTGLNESRAVLVAGQGLMVLQILTIYALAAGLTGRPWAGVAAALAACGLSPMPGFYLNWGRYTQLAGQVLVPVAALVTAWAAGRRRTIGLAGFMVAGLALTHYVVSGLFALLVVAWWLVDPPVRPLRLALAARLRMLPPCFAVAAVAVLFTMPWLPRLAAGHLGAIASAQVQPAAVKGEVFGLVDAGVVWGNLAPTNQHVGLLLLGVVLAALVGPRIVANPLTRLGLSWLALLLVAAYPHLVGLPLRSLIKDFTLAIALYLPLGLVLGGAAGDWPPHVAVADDHSDGGVVDRRGVVGVVNRRGVLAALGALGLGLTGLWLDRSPVQARFVYATPADLAAIGWIRAHTPPEAVFLVSSAKAFGDTVIAGDDGGWWLPVLADRETTLPPITYGLERSADPDYRLKVNALFDAWHDHWDRSEALAALDAAGVTHAYVGPTAKGLDPALLAASPHWREVYAKDGAKVYERVPDSLK